MNRKSLKNLIAFSRELHIGELSVLALAKEYKTPLLLIDDKVAREVAEVLGYTARGTIFVLLLSLKKNLITKKDAVACIDKLISFVFRISVELYKELINYLTSVNEK